MLGVVDNFKGDPLPFTPKWNFSTNIDYRHELANGGTPFIGVTITGRSKSDSQPGAGRLRYLDGCKLDSSGDPVCFLMPGVTNPFGLNGYVTIDGRIGYEGPEGAYRVMLWGKNLTNKYYWTNVISSADAASRFAGRPATYGITVGFKMK